MISDCPKRMEFGILGRPVQKFVTVGTKYTGLTMNHHLKDVWEARKIWYNSQSIVRMFKRPYPNAHHWLGKITSRINKVLTPFQKKICQHRPSLVFTPHSFKHRQRKNAMSHFSLQRKWGHREMLLIGIGFPEKGSLDFRRTRRAGSYPYLLHAAPCMRENGGAGVEWECAWSTSRWVQRHRQL